jgi:hypothetical protein
MRVLVLMFAIRRPIVRMGRRGVVMPQRHANTCADGRESL